MSHKQILRVLAGLIVLICLCAHTAELFDSWDDTLQTGNDTESALVIGVLTIGSAIILAGVIAAVGVASRVATWFVRSVPATVRQRTFWAPTHIDSSPPALRI